MTPRLAASPFALRRPAAPQQRRSRPWLGWLCVAVSLGAHGALLALVIPDPSATPPAELSAEDAAPLEDIAVTVLPKPAIPINEDPVLAAKVAPPVQSTPTPPTVPIAPTLPLPPDVEPLPSAPQAIALAPPAFTSPAAELEPEPALPGPYADFPHLDGAQATCSGLNDCWRSSVSSSWRGAASDLEARLEAQGYTLNDVTGEVIPLDSGVLVYTVSKPGEPRFYLNLVSVNDGVLYTMTPTPLTTGQVLDLQRS